MRVELVLVSKRPPWPLWAVAVVLLWLALGATAFVLARRAGLDVPACMFRRITGVPCPTCGFTRGALCILRGQVLAGWLHNPFLFSLLGFGAAVTLLRAAAGRAVRWKLTPTERSVALAMLAALFLANWAYVIVCVG